MRSLVGVPLARRWGAVTSSVYRAAADGWLDLPPQQVSQAVRSVN